MWPNLQFAVDSVRFTDEILNEKFRFLSNENCLNLKQKSLMHHFIFVQCEIFMWIAV